jgi:hypothetical protein
MTRFLAERRVILDERPEIQGSADQLAEVWSAYRAQELEQVLESILRLTDDYFARVGLVGYQLELKVRVVADARALASREWANSGGESEQEARLPVSGHA